MSALKYQANLSFYNSITEKKSGSEVVRISLFDIKAHDIISDIIDISFDSRESLYFAITLPVFAD